MFVAIEKITPGLAKEMLEKYWSKEQQRKPSPLVVSSYARAMSAKKWRLTHQGIAISDKGELVDGLHRLLAIIESGETIDSMVTYDLQECTEENGTRIIDCVDRGRVRSLGQILQMQGFKNGKDLAAVARQVLILCARSFFSSTSFFGKDSMAVFKVVYSEYGEEIDFCLKARIRSKLTRRAFITGAAAFAMKAYKQEVLDFYHMVVTGENIKHGDPAMTLRRFLESDRAFIGMRGGNLADIPNAFLNCAMKHVLKEKTSRLISGDHGYRFFASKQTAHSYHVLSGCGYSFPELWTEREKNGYPGFPIMKKD